MRVRDLYVVSNKYEISGGIPLNAEILYQQNLSYSYITSQDEI